VNAANAKPGTVFLFDVDNTLLDNDHVADDLKRYLKKKVGEPSAGRYWEIFEQLRAELGYADYLGALQRYRAEHPREPKLLATSHFLIDYPFANRLYPESIDAVVYAQRLGRAAILSDGDAVFQPRKIDRSGLFEVFDGQILIYIHKELELDDVEARYPAAHYVMVDDKVRILTEFKKHWGARVTTVFPRQGHYALNAAEVARYPKPDVTLERIGDLQKYSLEQLLAAAGN
jgi:FMN phosphatase YigB (HAD superfamily)